ncbi:ribonuclease H-like domain-containing protein [Tanacetum coccineum]|uniref:Ribonuclease H-like domain-containing protein n=1 Tax=Tanacetum coccineum TaxID=301880 RepID=A0ABQ4YIB5_9ASTR
MRHKFNADGSLSRYKARLVANGRSQQHGIDCDKTFSPNAFLHGQLSETVYMHQPPGFVDSSRPDYVCHLKRSLYGLKQAPRAWFQRFASFVTRDALLQRIIALLHSEFAMTNLGSLNYFLEEILERAHMQHCNPCQTPVDTESKLGSDGDPISDPSLYHSLADALQCLAFTRPDLSYVVQQVCLYMHNLCDPHFTALKRILCYVRGTFDYGLQLHVSSTTQLTVYTDADWAGCPVTCWSTSGYCMFLGDNLLSWFAKRQDTLSRSSAKAKYRGVANVVVETSWLRNLLREFHTPLFTATLVYCENVSDVYMSANPVQYQRTKHIEIDIHFVRDFVASRQVRVLHVPSRFQYADIFTKGLTIALFIEYKGLKTKQKRSVSNGRPFEFLPKRSRVRARLCLVMQLVPQPRQLTRGATWLTRGATWLTHGAT